MEMGKEYHSYNGKLIFEGEYINGEKNGRGKEYYIRSPDEEILIFDGEYINGKKNGKVKEIDDVKNCVIFSSEYLNGERNGIGKEYEHNF